MTQDKIIEWAREARLMFHIPFPSDSGVAVALHRFAALVADHAAKQEREACALVCDELPAPPSCKGVEKSLWAVTSMACGDAILARSKP